MKFSTRISGLILFLLASIASEAQIIVDYNSIELSQKDIDSLHLHYGQNKKLAEGFEIPMLIAISHFPSLKEARIEFRLQDKGAPLASRPTVWTTFFRTKKKRKYIITINDRQDSWFSGIQLRNLPLNAQIGVLGHELAHSHEFVSTGFFGMMGIAFGNLSWKYLDKFEYNTDKMTIDHGLGYQLLEWSEITQQMLVKAGLAEAVEEKANGRERYMKPRTIRNYISLDPNYITASSQ